jgi:hypothetical protein
MRKAIFSLDNGPMIAYHLGNNRDVADAIVKLSPERQVYELYKLETKLLLAQKTKTKTDAPDPIVPVGGITQSEKDPSKMSIGEWMEWDKQKRLDKLKIR